MKNEEGVKFKQILSFTGNDELTIREARVGLATRSEQMTLNIF